MRHLQFLLSMLAVTGVVEAAGFAVIEIKRREIDGNSEGALEGDEMLRYQFLQMSPQSRQLEDEKVADRRILNYSAGKRTKGDDEDDDDSSAEGIDLTTPRTTTPRRQVLSPQRTASSPPPSILATPTRHLQDINSIINANPHPSSAKAALELFGTLMGAPAPPHHLHHQHHHRSISQVSAGLEHLQHPSNDVDPYVALLLSRYGRHGPIFGKARRLYAYSAANNYHNNKPFGAYKIEEEEDDGT